mmetsp:Transcript_21951/g.32875  ORF Transcript_21951/g.32875 Transcript_21951/m.32875 type:complete len:82 (+) Transcript_21951:412-657(+)
MKYFTNQQEIFLNFQRFMDWILGRNCIGTKFADESGTIMSTKYSSSLFHAHLEYGRLMYPNDANFCHHCGIVSPEGKGSKS